MNMNTTLPNSAAPNVELANVDPQTGKAPAKRLGTATAAQQLGNLLIRSNVSRSLANARIKGSIDGNPPYSNPKLRSNNQAWRSNFNPGGAEASVSAAVTPFDDLINGSPYFAEVKTKYGTAQERSDYSQILSEKFDYILRDWDGFDFQMQAMNWEMVAYGKGFLVWLDPTSWHFEWVQQYLTYVPERTKAYTGKVPLVMLRLNYELHELWEIAVENPKAADAGWKVDAVKRAIESAFPPNPDGTPAGTYPSYEIIQQKLKENELYEGYRSRVVQVLHFFTVEFDGRVTHQIVTETNPPNAGQPDMAMEPQFLYEAKGKYDSLSDVVATFFYECSDGTWNGARGLGKKIFPLVEVQARMFNAVIDNGFMRSGISLQANTAEAVQKLNLLQIGPFNIIPPGFAVQQSTIMGDLTGGLEIDRALEQKIGEYTGVYKPRIDKPVGNPRTKAEVVLDYERSATLSQPSVNRYYRNLDRFYYPLFKRVCKFSKEFKQECIEAGIPAELWDQVIKKVCSVRAYRAVGNGNVYMRRSALEKMGPLVPMMPESGKVAWLRDSVAALTNKDAVDRYAPLPESDMPNEDTSIAVLENAAMKIGSPVIWTPTQNNVIHAQTHLQAGSAAAASLQQGGNPLEIMHFIDAVGAHTAEHLQHMSGDPTRQNELKLLGDQWKKLADFADQLRQEINRKAKEAAANMPPPNQNGQMSADDQAKLQKTQADIQMKAAKNQQLMQQKSEKHQQQMAQAAQRFQQDMAIADAEAANDMVRDHAKFVNKTQTETAKP